MKTKEIFRKNVIDIIAILPSKEGTVEMGKDNYTTMRIPINIATNIDLMNKCFRQMWVILAKQDPILSKEFETYFKNEALEKARVEKLLQKMAIKGDKKKQEKLEKKLKEFESKETVKFGENK